MADADELERAVWDALVRGGVHGDDRQEALAQVDQALGLREAAQGPEHPDLIWPLALKIELLRCEHSREASRRAAQIGERRLALQRRALAGAPAELAASVRALADLYVFEDEVLDPARVRALTDELQQLALGRGERRDGG